MEQGLMPADLAGKLAMAQTLIQSGLMPRQFQRAEALVVALQMGHELGIPPLMAVNNISVINGRPVLSADIMLAVARRTGELEDIRFDVNEKRAIIHIKRRGQTEHMSPFSLEDAREAGLLPNRPESAWTRHPKRMMRARALSFAMKDIFGDVLAGLYTPDEGEEIADADGGPAFFSTKPLAAIQLSPPPPPTPPFPDASPIVSEPQAAPIVSSPGNAEDRLRPLWQSVHDRCKAVGLPCVEILKGIVPGMMSVREWMRGAWEERDFDGLKKFDEALKKFQAKTPNEFSAPSVSDLPNGGNGTAEKKPKANGGIPWTAEKGPGNPFGLSMRASKILAAAEKWCREQGRDRFLPSDIPFPGKTGNATGSFLGVRLDLERAGLIREAEDHKGFLLLTLSSVPTANGTVVELPPREEGHDDDAEGDLPAGDASEIE